FTAFGGDYSSEFVRQHADAFREHPVNQNSYNMPYRFYPAPVSGLLCLIVSANLVYGALPRVPLSIAYVGLFLSLACGFAAEIVLRMVDATGSGGHIGLVHAGFLCWAHLYFKFCAGGFSGQRAGIEP